MLGLVAPQAAHAHAFGASYNLPVPLWLYLYGCSAALAVSFVVMAFFVRHPKAVAGGERHAREPPDYRRTGAEVPGIPARIGVAVLLLCIVAGHFGSQSPQANFNMTFFWVIFLLGMQYVTALRGDIFRPANPWRTLSEWIEPRLHDSGGKLQLPEWVSGYAAFLLFFGLIWLELFGHPSPRALSHILLGYTAFNLAGSYLIGRSRWYGEFELFGVLFALVGRLGGVLGGLSTVPIRSTGTALFIVFMLSSTAFDGLKDTKPFVQIYWVHFYGWISQYLGSDIVQTFPLLQRLFHAFAYACLFLSPLPFLLALLAAAACCRFVTRSPLRIRHIAWSFLPSLIPIAIAYNFAHYFTLLMSEGPRIVQLTLDPFGNGWNLAGVARWDLRVFVPVSVIWHVQVAVILVGHVAGVYAAHLIALREFPTARQATFSQIPMVVLMMLYTSAGLWILNQPLSSEAALIR